MDYKEKVIALLNSQELSKEQKEKLENIFPELKEKESEDERIRREIIEYITLYKDSLCDEEYNSWIAWLEKQGNKSVNIDIESMVSSYEQRLKSQGGVKYSPLVNMCLTAFRHGVENVLEELNLKKLEKQSENKPIDKVEPKFHEGDWILNNVCFPMQIASIKDGMYIFTKGDAISVSFIDENYHLWSIQDAVAGDVLYYKAASGTEFIMVLKNVTRSGILNSYCRYNSDDGFDINVPSVMSVRDNPKPATKEQRDLLFQKMKEAGYEWDSEKKDCPKTYEQSTIITTTET